MQRIIKILKIRGLQPRLAIFMFLPVAVLLIGMGLAGFIYARNSLLTEWSEAATLKLQRTAHEVDMRLSRAKEWLKMFHTTGDDPYAVYYHDLIIEQLQKVKGVVRVNLNWNAGNRSLEIQKRGLIPFLQSSAVDITTPHYDSLVKNETVSLASDLKTKTGRTVGRLEVVIRFSYLRDAILSSGWRHSDQAYLVDNNGRILLSIGTAHRAQLGENDDPLEVKTLAAMRQKPFGTVIEGGFPTPANVSGYYKLKEAPWSLVMFASGKNILAPIVKLQWYYIISGAVFIFLVLILIRLALGRTVFLIQELSKAAHDVSRGHFVTLDPPKTRDEVCDLVCSFNTMVLQLEERLRLKESLNLAMEVQQNLLPQKPFQNKHIDIAGQSIYCEKTGGDYYDFYPLPGTNGNRIVIAVGDVVGHGIPAALLMTTVRALLRSRMSQPGSLAEKIADVNRLLCMDTTISCDYMTLMVMMVDTAQGEIQWVRAGHDPAIVYDPQQDAFAELNGDGMALGIDGAYTFEENRRSNFTAGQTIAVGTDGIWESENQEGEKFGRDRFRQCVRRHSRRSSREIMKSILADLATFRRTAPQNDDITLVVVKAK
jgi:sigma-B regulation protein RsbU (phosphoserine phosphatase)